MAICHILLFVFCKDVIAFKFLWLSAQIQQWLLTVLVLIGLISLADSLEELDVMDMIPFGNVKPLFYFPFLLLVWTIILFLSYFNSSWWSPTSKRQVLDMIVKDYIAQLCCNTLWLESTRLEHLVIAFFTSWKYAHLFQKLCKGDGLLIVDFELSKARAFKVIFCLLSKKYCNQENFKLKYKYHNYYTIVRNK